MKLKEYFEQIELNDIEEFVEKQTPEDLYIEFKTVNFPNDSTKFDDKNFSKCLSGFANSLGGILIWGVKASTNSDGIDAAKELKPIQTLRKFENYLKRLEGKAVVPPIDGIEYRRIEKAPNDGYLLVYIPQSERAPHMAQYSDKHYYKRSGDNFYQCEHFDIMDMLNRNISPKLTVEIQYEEINKHPRDTQDFFKYSCIIKVNNIGKIEAKFLSIFIKVNSPFKVADYGIYGNGNNGMKKIQTGDGFIRYFGGADLIIHPGTSLEVEKIVLNEIGLERHIDDLILEYKIVAEKMSIISGKITRSKEELLNKFN